MNYFAKLVLILLSISLLISSPILAKERGGGRNPEDTNRVENK